MSKLPTVEELQTLVKDKIITQEEARNILFSEEEPKTDGDSRDEKSLKSEIKFLRELVEHLSKNRTHVIETIKTVEAPYRRYPWYGPYATWCGNLASTTNDTTDWVNGAYSTSGSGTVNLVNAVMKSFDDISTF